LKVVPSRVTAPKLFGFPPSPAQVSLPLVVHVVSLPAQVSPPLRCNPDGASRTVSQLTTPPSIGATELGEKLRSSFPVVSKPFQSYIKKARILREGVSLKWNDVLLSDSLKASKLVADLAVNKVAVAEPPVKTSILRKGFLNPRPKMLATPASPRKVFDVGMVGPSSPLEVVPFLHLLRVIVSPNLGIGRSVLIITGRFWFGRRTLIFGMFRL
jgi:hypothetical protein